MGDPELHARLEIKGAVESMIKNLGPIAERNPQATIKGEDFNTLLERAREVFPGSGAMRDLSKIEDVTTFADLLAKLSILAGAVKADFSARSIEEAARPRRDD